MRKIYSLLATLIILLPFHLTAQKFENSYSFPGNEMGNDVVELSDGSIITVGNTNSYGSGGNDLMVTKSSKSGELLWVKYVGGTGTDAGNGVALGLNDEIYCAGSITVGNNTDGYLVKLDVSGNILWTKTFGGSGNDEFKDIVYKSGKIYAIGNTASSGAGALDIWFVKTDVDGNTIQNKTLGFASDENANAMTLTADGNLAIAGRTASFVGYNVFVAKFNLSGDTLWTRKYNYYLNGGTSSGPAGKGIAELSNQNLMICGIGWDGIGNYSSTFHLRLDANGNTIYSKWTTLLSDGGADVLAGKNGSYYLLINSCNFGCPIVLKKFDANGTETLYKIFQYAGGNSYANFAFPGRLCAASGSKILITGSSYLRENNADLYLARIDTNGIAYTTTAPVITPSGATTFCEGASVTLTVPAGYTRYSWGRTLSNNMAYMGVSSNSIVVKTSGLYFCTLWNAKGMRTTAMVNVVVTPIPVGTITTTGSLNFCAAVGESLTLTANTGYTSYQWYKDGVVIPGAVSNAYSPTVSGSYYVNISNVCASITSVTKVVNVNSIPTPIISCSTFDCFAGGTNNCYPPAGSLSVQPITGATYSWQAYNTILQISTSNFLNSPYPPGDYIVTATNACGSATSSTYNINTNPQNPYAGSAIEYFGPINGCGVGSNVTLYAPVGAFSPYTWYFNGVPIPGATNYFYIAQQSGSYSMSYLDVNCFNTFNTTAPVYVNLNTTSPTLSTPLGNTNCGGTVQINAQPTGVGITYTWYRDNVLLSSGAASTYNATVSGSYTCLVNNPACGTKMSPAIHVNAGAPIGSAVIQEAIICSGTSTQLYCSPLQGTNYTYQWKLNNVNIAGATSPNYFATLAGNYKCNITNACSTITTNTVSLSVMQSPTAVITPPLSNVICTPASATLTANTVSNATYQWLRNGSNVLNATQNSVVTNLAGTYTISITANGCNTISAPVVMTSSAGPSSLITTNKYPLICSGDSVYLKSPSASSTTWQWNKDNVAIVGATDSIYKAMASGVYNVSVTNPCSTIVSNSIEVIVKSKPSAVITPLGATSFCNGDSVMLQGSIGTSYTYYWKRNNNVIANAIESAYTAKQAGTYKVGIYSKYGCLKESAGLTVTVPCRLDGEDNGWSEENIIVYPNPSAGVFSINWQGNDSDENIYLLCFDLQGRIVELEMMDADMLQFQLRNVESGVYFLQIIRGDKSITKKIIKL
jgi:Secretion system C-terminal sorting domain